MRGSQSTSRQIVYRHARRRFCRDFGRCPCLGREHGIVEVLAGTCEECGLALIALAHGRSHFINTLADLTLPRHALIRPPFGPRAASRIHQVDRTLCRVPKIVNCPSKRDVEPWAACAGRMQCAWDLVTASPACDGTTITIQTSCLCDEGIWKCPNAYA